MKSTTFAVALVTLTNAIKTPKRTELTLAAMDDTADYFEWNEEKWEDCGCNECDMSMDCWDKCYDCYYSEDANDENGEDGDDAAAIDDPAEYEWNEEKWEECGCNECDMSMDCWDKCNDCYYSEDDNPAGDGEDEGKDDGEDDGKPIDDGEDDGKPIDDGEDEGKDDGGDDGATIDGGEFEWNEEKWDKCGCNECDMEMGCWDKCYECYYSEDDNPAGDGEDDGKDDDIPPIDDGEDDGKDDDIPPIDDGEDDGKDDGEDDGPIIDDVEYDGRYW